MDLIETIRKLIADELEIPIQNILDNRSLRGEYGLDSVAAVNVIFALETQLGISVDVKDIVNVDTINDLRQLIQRRFPG